MSAKQKKKKKKNLKNHTTTALYVKLSEVIQ